ncbi:hypothetical protein GTQ99_13240 [Kineococcus sp. T13]|nr:hypothetical protein [Kineococcus vitellinus]
MPARRAPLAAPAGEAGDAPGTAPGTGSPVRVVRAPRPRAVDRAGWAGAVVAAAVLVHLLLAWRLRGFVTDDSWITVRYAENLAAGAGWVWNPDGPVVEGASNPLLVLLEALVVALGGSALRTAQVLGVAGGVACVLLVGLGGRAVLGRGAAAAGALLTAASAPFAAWAVGGLETLPVAALLTAGVLQLARPDGGRAPVAAAAFATLPWWRPEGLLVVAAVVGLSELTTVLALVRRRRPRPGALRRLLWLVGLPCAAQLALEALRWSVYGHLLPNSVLYKAGTGAPFDVLEKFLDQSAVVVVPALLGALLVRGRARLLLVPPLVHAAGSVGTLDSANAFSRFLLPAWPVLALLAGLALVRPALLLPRRAQQPAAVLLAVAVAAAALLAPGGGAERVDGWQQRYTACKAGARAEAAAWLRTTPASTTYGVSDAGLVPARAGRTAVDMFLLNDPLLQETGPLPPQRRAEEVLERRPDVLVLVSRSPREFRAGYPTDAAVHERAVAAGYRLAHVARGTGAGCAYHLWALRR